MRKKNINEISNETQNERIEKNSHLFIIYFILKFHMAEHNIYIIFYCDIRKKEKL